LHSDVYLHPVEHSTNRMLSTMSLELRIYSDGASRGNPGPSAISFMILDEKGEALKSCSKYIGMKTNNQAEYHALISALESASKLTQQAVTCHLDSELVVKQLKGAYRVRNLTLKALWLKVGELARRFRKISFKHVPRTDRYIQEVDRLANQTLEEIG